MALSDEPAVSFDANVPIFRTLRFCVKEVYTIHVSGCWLAVDVYHENPSITMPFEFVSIRAPTGAFVTLEIPA